MNIVIVTLVKHVYGDITMQIKTINRIRKTISIVLMTIMLLINTQATYVIAETQDAVSEEISETVTSETQTEESSETPEEPAPALLSATSEESVEETQEVQEAPVTNTEAISEETPECTETDDTTQQDSSAPDGGSVEEMPAGSAITEEETTARTDTEEENSEKSTKDASDAEESITEEKETEEGTKKKKKDKDDEKETEILPIIFYVSGEELKESSIEKESDYTETYDVTPDAQEITASYNDETIPVAIDDIQDAEAEEGIISGLEGGETFTVKYKAEVEDTTASFSCTYHILMPEEEEEDPISTLTFISDCYEVTVSGPKEILHKGTQLTVTEITENEAEEKTEEKSAEETADTDSGLLKYDEYKEGAAEMLEMQAEQLSYVKVLDITLTDIDGKQFEPSDLVEVKIHLLDKDELDEIGPQIIHFGKTTEVMDSTTEKKDQGYEVSFETSAFSVYVIVDAPEPVIPEEETGLNGKDMYLYVSKNGNQYWVTDTRANTTNGKNWLAYNTTNPEIPFHFEQIENTNEYYISVNTGNMTRYLVMDNNENLQLSTTDKTAFTVRMVNGSPDVVYICHQFGSKTYYMNLKMKGGANNGIGGSTYNDAGSYVTLVPLEEEVDTDIYELNNKTYGIAYHNEDISGAALTSTAQNASTLAAMLVRVKPDVLNNNGLLLVAEGTDIDQWTFEWVTKNCYYLKTIVDDEPKYMTINGNRLTLNDTPDQVHSLISVNPGSDANSGKIQFTVAGKAVTLKNGDSTQGFIASDTGSQYSWLNLVEKSPLLDDDDFTVYSAQKVSISNLSEVYNGRKLIIYTRIWNTETLKYDYYTVNYDGTLIRCRENGDTIQWYGSKINTAEWQFTEYYDQGTSTPNNYYEFQNMYSGQYLAPQLTGGQIMSDSTIGVNLQGRRYGDNYSTILAWDDPYYDYAGLAVQDGHLVSVPMAQAQEFYVAVLDETYAPDELTTARTIDNTEFGISMKMVDFNNQVVNARDSGQTAVLGLNTDGVGLVETNLQDDGYPMTVSARTKQPKQSLSTLFGSAQPVNHLFLRGTYEESGYFEFDSTKNFAYLNGSDFTVYNQIATIDGSSFSQDHGQFIPYNDLYIPGTTTPRPYSTKHRNTTNTTNQPLPDSDPNKNAPLMAVPQNETDYFFGMELEAQFSQTVSGLDVWGHDIIFDFSGDDDMWLYVDGELVLDLGGVHSAQTGSINFKTGEVQTSRTSPTNLRAIFKQNYETRHPGATEAEVNAYLDEIFEEGENVFKDYSSHTMKVFYMERGSGSSNLHMKFNLAAVKPGQIQLTKAIAGTEKKDWNLVEYPYQIYYKSSIDNEFHLLTQEMQQHGFTVVYKGTTVPVRSESLYHTSDGDEYEHVYFLKPGQTAEINMPDETIAYYIVECGIKQNLYEKVTVNDEEIEGTPAAHGRVDYVMDETTIEETPRVTYTNHIDDNALRTLTIKKVLHDESGAVISPADDNTEFTFRLSLASEFEDNLAPCNMVPYHLKDNLGRYVIRDGENNQFISLPKTVFNTLTDEEKAAATFTTSPHGSVSKIPAGYSVELNDILVGTKFKVEEKEYEIPVGYRFMEYRRVDGSYIAEDGDEYNIGVVRDNANPAIEVHNQRGISISVEKEWSDTAFMETHDNVFFAAYCDGTLMPGTVRQMKEKVTADNPAPEHALHYFFDSLPAGKTINDIRIMEVRLSDPVVGEDGYVTSYSTIEPVEQDQTIILGGQEKGDVYRDDAYSYSVDYQMGNIEGVANNIRTDTVTNTRPGIRIRKSDWAGNPLTGGSFTITDDHGDAVGDDVYHADENGLITTAYFQTGTEYTLTETKTPNGYALAAESIKITVDNNNQVSVSGTDSSNYVIEQATTTTMASVTLKNKPYDIQVKKVNQGTDAPIEGVHFSVFRSVAGIRDYYPITGYEDLVTGADGFLPDTLKNLEPGTYYLSETAAASGYSPIDDDIEFTISETGVVTINTTGYTSWISAAETTPGAVTYTMRIPNQRATNIVVRKVISGGFGNKNDKFRFALSNFVYNGHPLTGVYQYSIYHDTGLTSSVEETGVVTIQERGGSSSAVFRKSGTTDSTSHILIGHNRRLVIMDVPNGTAFTVTEDESAGYTPSCKVFNETGTAPYYEDGAMTPAGTAQGLSVTVSDNGRTIAVSGPSNNGIMVLYTNTRNGTLPTGIQSDVSMLTLINTFMLTILVFAYIARKRRKPM